MPPALYVLAAHARQVGELSSLRIPAGHGPVGSADGLALGDTDGLSLGDKVGDADGLPLGDALGLALGETLGADGLAVVVDGLALGLALGDASQVDPRQVRSAPQSEWLQQPWSVTHAPQTGPPQSTSVSKPFSSPSVHSDCDGDVVEVVELHAGTVPSWGWLSRATRTSWLACSGETDWIAGSRPARAGASSAPFWGTAAFASWPAPPPGA